MLPIFWNEPDWNVQIELIEKWPNSKHSFSLPPARSAHKLERVEKLFSQLREISFNNLVSTFKETVFF